MKNCREELTGEEDDRLIKTKEINVDPEKKKGEKEKKKRKVKQDLELRDKEPKFKKRWMLLYM